MESKIIGLTGPTGAGKSTVATELRRQGCIILDCDQIAREVTEIGQPCLQELAEVFGRDILLETGALNRKGLAQKAFAAPEQTQLLNQITHPWIRKRIQENLEKLRAIGVSIIILDAALLFESGADILCSRVIAVTAPVPLRLERIMLRDGISEDLARSRMRAQHSDVFYTERADFCIDGTLSSGELSCQIAGILQKIRKEEELHENS